jgi:hypothetical protein
MIVFTVFVLFAAAGNFGALIGTGEVMTNAAGAASPDSASVGAGVLASVMTVLVGTLATLWRR